MKAVTYNRYGGPEVLSLKQLERPQPGKNEILVRTRAAEVTKADCEIRSFDFAVKWFWLPLRLAIGVFRPRRPVLGGYFSGEVESVGEAVTRFKPGDKVFGSTQLGLGAHAEYLCIPETYSIAHNPKNMSFEQAAAIPLGGLNALHFMQLAQIKPGDQLLINGAGGSIGTFAVQIAKMLGAEVTAVDSGIKENMLRDIGVDHFIDYELTDFTRGKKSYDVIFNMVARNSYTGCIRVLRAGGRYLMGNPRLSDMLRSILTPRFSDKKVYFRFAGETQQELEQLRDWVEEDQIYPVIDKIYSMNDSIDAHYRVETEQRLGIVVISIDSL